MSNFGELSFIDIYVYAYYSHNIGTCTIRGIPKPVFWIVWLIHYIINYRYWKLKYMINYRTYTIIILLWCTTLRGRLVGITTSSRDVLGYQVSRYRYHAYAGILYMATILYLPMGYDSVAYLEFICRWVSPIYILYYITEHRYLH